MIVRVGHADERGAQPAIPCPEEPVCESFRERFDLPGRSVQDLVAAQSELVRDNLQQLLDATRRIAEVSLRFAEEATRTIEAEDKRNSRHRRAA